MEYHLKMQEDKASKESFNDLTISVLSDSNNQEDSSDILSTPLNLAKAGKWTLEEV